MLPVRGIFDKLKRRIQGLVSGESGQALVAVAVTVTVLLGGAALAVDLGASYAAKQKLQIAADEAALAGARALSNSVSNTAAARTSALDYAEMNGADRGNTTVTVPYNGNKYKIEVVCTQKVNYGFASVFGKTSGMVTARAVAECQTMRGPFDYAIFSGSTNYELQFNVGYMRVGGSIHSNDDVALRSTDIVVNGDVETVNDMYINGGVTINGECVGAQINRDGAVVARNDQGPYVDMPDFTETIKAAAQRAGTYYRNSQKFFSSTQYYGNHVYVDEPVYVEGDISFSTPIVVSGSGIIIATGNITFNAASVLAPGSSVCFYSKNGNIQVNAGEITVDGLLYAPNGMIQANTASFTVNGRVVANKLQFNSSVVKVNSGDHDRDCLPKTSIALSE